MARYKLLARSSFRKDLKRLSKDVAERVSLKVERLAADPFPADSKKLQGHKGLYRVRVGAYRIVYEVDTEVKLIALTYVRHRKDVYRNL